MSLDLATITIERARAMQARHIAMTSDLFRPGPFTSHNKTGDQEKERKKGLAPWQVWYPSQTYLA